jgi:hypothetical protein
MKKTIAVDFDGVIHAYTSPWTKPEEISDGPMPGAVEWLKEISPHYQVVVFSSRAEEYAGHAAIRRWLTENGVTDYVHWVTAKKPPAVLYVDDRGFRFGGHFPSLAEIETLSRPWKTGEPIGEHAEMAAEAERARLAEEAYVEGYIDGYHSESGDGPRGGWKESVIRKRFLEEPKPLSGRHFTEDECRAVATLLTATSARWREIPVNVRGAAKNLATTLGLKWGETT